MKFGKVDEPGIIDFTIPKDHPGTEKSLRNSNYNDFFRVYVGCAKWNKQDLKNFYPRGVKDELSYYSTQFNSIEMNSTFYSMPDKHQVHKWKSKTPEGFRFFPKITNTISHFRRLLNTDQLVEEFADSICGFEEKLGIAFLQLNNNYKPKDFERLESFLQRFPKEIPLAVEVRHPEWFEDPIISDRYFQLLESENMTNILVDTAGRRDIMHMRLTGASAFIRFVGANHESDYTRLDDWVNRIEVWRKQGLNQLGFFIHQNVERESPLLASYFIQKLNKSFDLSMVVPSTNTPISQ